MKRIIAVLIMLFMITPIGLYFSINNNQTDIEDIQPISVSELKEELVIVEPVLDPYEVAIQNMQDEMFKLESITDRKEWYLAYKDIVYKYIKWVDPPETIYDYFTEDEVKLMCRVVETECYQQDFESKCNVASVVMNRYEHGGFGETITEIVTSPNQFCYGRKSVTEDTILAVMYVWEIEDTADGALYFHSNPKTDTFNGANYIFSDVAEHHFYK